MVIVGQRCKGISEKTGKRCKNYTTQGDLCNVHRPIEQRNLGYQGRNKTRNKTIRLEVSEREFELMLRESEAYGFPYYSRFVRFKVFDEPNEIIRKTEILWREFGAIKKQTQFNNKRINNMLGIPIKTKGHQKKQNYCLKCAKHVPSDRDYCKECIDKRLAEVRKGEIKQRPAIVRLMKEKIKV